MSVQVRILEAPGAAALQRIVQTQLDQDSGWKTVGSPFHTGLFLPQEGRDLGGIPGPATHVPVLGWAIERTDS